MKLQLFIYQIILLINYFYFVKGDPQLTIINNCPYSIWPAYQVGAGQSLPNNGGSGELKKGNVFSFKVPSKTSALRIWARTGCNKDAKGCATGECIGKGIQCAGIGGEPPLSLAEFTFGTPSGDFYDVSLVDGFNLPISIEPKGGKGPKCKTIKGCDLRKLASQLPGKMVKKDRNGNVIAILSPCEAFNDNALCCRGQWNNPNSCHLVYKNYDIYLKENRECSQQYLYAYDDEKATFVCNPGGNVNYNIKFCP
ncbi:Pept_C1 domain-containing protein [Meloidogyne graminicola]|uniref:Pept_C1 domain-containing protein n=1 Tax=Meloidogyne graminicola TaxID=189291 RepID=A0A8T0A214_9BILA|nr:Pept_C1 domain-containing protein [Meloidogyne graminicola]